MIAGAYGAYSVYFKHFILTYKVGMQYRAYFAGEETGT